MEDQPNQVNRRPGERFIHACLLEYFRLGSAIPDHALLDRIHKALDEIDRSKRIYQPRPNNPVPRSTN